MATTLRELIARVVFRADPSKIKDFDAKLDGLKAKLTGVDVKTNELSATLSKSAERFLGLRVALQDVNGALDPAQVEAYSAAFKASEARADEVRKAIDRLRLIDPKNKELPELQRQLSAVEKESKEAAAALERVGVAVKKTQPAGGAGAASGLGGISKLIGGLTAAAAAYKAVAFGKTVLAEADAVGKLAAQLGISTDDLQVWSTFASQAGASNEHLSVSVKTLAKNIETAAGTAKGPAVDAFKKLGISTAGWTKSMPRTMDVLLAVGGALGEATNESERLALAQQLLGEGGVKLLPGFKDGTKAAKDQLDALRDLAIIYDAEFIKNAEAANDEMDMFGRQLKGVGAQVVLAVLPALRDFVRWLTPVIKRVREVVGSSNALSAALGVGAAAGVMKLVGNFGKLVNILKVGRGILLRFVLPFLLLDDLISFLKGEQSVIGDILDAMFGAGAAAAVVEELRDAWEGVKDASSSLWDTLGLVIDRAFDTGKAGKMSADEFEMAFLKASDGIGRTFDSLFDKISRAAQGWKWWLFDRGDEQEADAAAASRTKELEDKIANERAAIEAARARLASFSQNAQNGLALGGAPAVSQRSSSSVTVNDNSTITTNLNGVDAQNVGPALRQTERNIAAELKRNKAQVLRQTVGAVGA